MANHEGPHTLRAMHHEEPHNFVPEHPERTPQFWNTAINHEDHEKAALHTHRVLQP